MQSTETSSRDVERALARDVAIPAVGLSSLRRHLSKEAGALATIHALQAAGYGAGEALWHGLDQGPSRESLAELDQERFWERLATLLSRRGWGTLTYRSAHPGVGLLASRDWAEAGGSGEPQPSCSFSAGLLSGLLSGVAGDPIAVLEVTCRAAGDDQCTFAFGAAGTVHDLYGLLLEGRPLESALDAL